MQLARIDRRQTRIRCISRRVMRLSDPRLGHTGETPEEHISNTPNEHHHIGGSQNYPNDLLLFAWHNTGDSAVNIRFYVTFAQVSHGTLTEFYPEAKSALIT